MLPFKQVGFKRSKYLISCYLFFSWNRRVQIRSIWRCSPVQERCSWALSWFSCIGTLLTTLLSKKGCSYNPCFKVRKILWAASSLQMPRQRFLIPLKDKSALHVPKLKSVGHMHQKCIFQGMIPLSLMARRALCIKAYSSLKKCMYHCHAKQSVFQVSQSVALFPSSMETLGQRYQAFSGTTCLKNSQGGEQKNTPVLQRTVLRPVQNGITNLGDRWALYKQTQ